jgi:hypothetical protein
VYVHTTTYQVSWIRAELVLKLGDDDKNPTRIARDFDNSQLPALQRLQQRLKEEDARATAVALTLSQLQVDRIPGDVVTSVEKYVPSDAATVEALNRARSDVTDLPQRPEATKEVAQRFIGLIDRAGDKILESVLSEFLAIATIPEHPVDVLKLERSRSCIGNTVTLSSFIDYTRPYYYNVRAPMFSSINAQAELNSDLLLTKAQSQVDTTKVAESIEKLVPFKEIVTGALHGVIGGGAARAMLSTSKPVSRTIFTLSLEEQIRIVEVTERKTSASGLTPGQLGLNAQSEFVVKPVSETRKSP